MKKPAMFVWCALLTVLLIPVPSRAKVDLVTLPSRDKVQLTIYNSADLTLARDIRTLTMRDGSNRLQFSWSGTLIDPTSLEMMPVSETRDLQVSSLQYPPRVQGLGIWNLHSDVSGEIPFEISYFTSGISWQAYYLATLAPDEKTMRLDGYVRVTNNSGEDYENAQTRLVVGKVNLLDRIADLARRKEPYGRPGPVMPAPMPGAALDGAVEREPAFYAARAELQKARPREIRKEGLSEYFLYTIEGTEDIASGWGKRLISFSVPSLRVRNLYRYEEELYGDRPVRFISFANDKEHNMGTEPIPGGLVKVFRETGKDGVLSYVGAEHTRYVPKGEDVNLNLGPSRDASVKVILVAYRTDNYEWRDETITGWDEHMAVRVEAENYRKTPVRVEIRRNFPVSSWELKNREGGSYGPYEQVDADTIQYTVDLDALEGKAFTYDLTLHMGSRGTR